MLGQRGWAVGERHETVSSPVGTRLPDACSREGCMSVLGFHIYTQIVCGTTCDCTFFIRGQRMSLNGARFKAVQYVCVCCCAAYYFLREQSGSFGRRLLG